MSELFRRRVVYEDRTVSVLTQPYAVPSRVLGVYRYLLRAKNQRESRENLVGILAPESLPRKTTAREAGEEAEEGGGTDMVKKTIQECVTMGLLGEEGDDIILSAALPVEARTPGQAESMLPVTLANLFFDPTRDANHDLGQAIAWYLSQDVYSAPNNWTSFGVELRAQVAGEQFGITSDPRYGMFEDWVCYLGFAWTHAIKDKRWLTPDPTDHLRRRLPDLFRQKPNQLQSLVEVMGRLSALCPVFENGFLRTKIDPFLRPRDPNHLSAATAHGWLRLREENLVRLTKESDANVLVLPDGDRQELVSHVAWLGDA